ncbi:MAG: hypothetical protein QNJ72_08010 [Pleurocapsa sp. MO_226.B13]|nr:hypothetical protein [Pleurocapsa sp. MO_226.B13]
MTKRKNSSNRGISPWQSHKMKQIIIDRWQEIWTVVEARNKTRTTDSIQ